MTKNMIVDSYVQFADLVHSEFDYGVFFRGLKDSDYPLLPSLGRYLDVLKQRGFDKGFLLTRERDALRIFRNEVKAHPVYQPRNAPEVLALAQHHGMPTRLMDWTLSPLVALYFAVVAPFDGESVVHAWRKETGCLDSEQVEHVDPFNLKDPIMYLPAHISPRIRAQMGTFSIHPDPTVPLEVPELVSIRISNRARDDCKWALYKAGVHAKSLFPDVEGLAAWLKWGHFEGFPSRSFSTLHNNSVQPTARSARGG